MIYEFGDIFSNSIDVHTEHNKNNKSSSGNVTMFRSEFIVAKLNP